MPSRKLLCGGSYSRKAVVHEVVGAREAVNVSQEQRLALRYVLCGKGLDLPGAAPHIFHVPPAPHTPHDMRTTIRYAATPAATVCKRVHPKSLYSLPVYVRCEAAAYLRLADGDHLTLSSLTGSSPGNWHRPPWSIMSSSGAKNFIFTFEPSGACCTAAKALELTTCSNQVRP